MNPLVWCLRADVAAELRSLRRYYHLSNGMESKSVDTRSIYRELGATLKEYPWAYAIVLLLVSKFVNSQAAALAAIVPVALAIGVDPAYIVASAPACYGYYILPTYPSDLAAIQFDRSGTTHIGRFVINHSFILPGLIGVSVSCVFGWIFAAMYGFL
ncbi:anaerobic C4-dicarboxylate transporter family protein [Escherichia sp. R-CC3]